LKVRKSLGFIDLFFASFSILIYFVL